MYNILKVGQIVRVEDCNGEFLERRIVAICGKLVFICTDQEFKRAKNEGREPLSVGWPVEFTGL